MHRLNIYSNRKQNPIKQSVSTGNINCVGSEDFATKLGSKLNLLKTQEEAFEIVEKKEDEKSTSWATSESKPISQIELSGVFLKSSPLG